MSTVVRYIYEPTRLILTWRSHLDGTSSKYFPVAELVQYDQKAIFKYLSASDQYQQARKNGFLGFPGVSLKSEGHDNALDLFIRRLPPDTREDYNLYLKQNRLPENFSGSTFALLAYTGGRLASDSFVLIPDVSDVVPPADILLDIHGLAYHLEKNEIKHIQEDSELTFRHEPDNEHDSYAVAIYLKDRKLGYVSRVISHAFLQLMRDFNIQGTVAKTIVTPYASRIVFLASVR